MDMQLNGKVALVTGAARDVGQVLCNAALVMSAALRDIASMPLSAAIV